jgi:3-mercaptopyruvate sulfurtransferase SseA
MAAKAKDWQAHVKGILKGELKRRNVSYADLAEKLGKLGIKENERNIANKIARGSFTAVFFVQCLEAIGCEMVHFGGQ